MSSKEEKKQNLDLEESQMTPPDDLGADEELKNRGKGSDRGDSKVHR